MKFVHIKTTWGTITLSFKGRQIVALDLPQLETAPSQPFRAESSKEGEPAADFFKELEDNGITAQIKTLPGTEFQKTVWEEIKRIPHGQTRTYGEIAAAIGRPDAVRAVGSACGANPLPIVIPCHRVVAQNGPGGYSGGLPWKKLLLEMEGWDCQNSGVSIHRRSATL